MTFVILILFCYETIIWRRKVNKVPVEWEQEVLFMELYYSSDEEKVKALELVRLPRWCMWWAQEIRTAETPVVFSCPLLTMSLFYILLGFSSLLQGLVEEWGMELHNNVTLRFTEQWMPTSADIAREYIFGNVKMSATSCSRFITQSKVFVGCVYVFSCVIIWHFIITAIQVALHYHFNYILDWTNGMNVFKLEFKCMQAYE